MLNIVEYLIEDESMEDKETAQAREKVRAQMRRSYHLAPELSQSGGVLEEDEFGPLPQANGPVSVKPYVPPTELIDSERSPFGDVLDAPMGV